jgi:hypothetical protein
MLLSDLPILSKNSSKCLELNSPGVVGGGWGYRNYDKNNPKSTTKNPQQYDKYDKTFVYL